MLVYPGINSPMVANATGNAWRPSRKVATFHTIGNQITVKKAVVPRLSQPCVGKKVHRFCTTLMRR
jgi:hypothetical protein